MTPAQVRILIEAIQAKPNSASGHLSSPAQVRILIEAIQGHWLEPYIHLCVALPLRPGEVLGAQWSMCDLDRGRLRIVQQLQEEDGTLCLTDLKTRSSRRTLHLPNMTVQMLRGHRERQEARKKKAGAAWQEHDLIFTTRHGKPLMERNVFRTFNGILERAGLPQQSLYALRHLSISLRIHQGAHIREIMEDAGHSQISLTMNTYGHIFDAARRDSADRMDAFLRTISPIPSAIQTENLPEVELNPNLTLTTVQTEVIPDPRKRRSAE